MNLVPATLSAPSPALADGFGQRVRSIDPDVGDEVELLELAPSLVEHDGFVAALGERVARVASVRHASYVHLRRLDRPAPDRLSLVSDYTPGWRLSELLGMGVETNTPLETTVMIGLLRQLLPALALFSRHNRESAIGNLAPERLIVTPQARLVIPEHAFGPALEKLNLGRDRFWREFRIAMPPSAGLPRANARADTNALGVIALSLLIGRTIEESEFPNALQALIESATERRNGETVPLSSPLSQWVTRALQFDVRHAFQTPHEAQVAFEAVLASDRGYVTTSGALERWVTEVGAAIEIANAPPPPPEPPPPIVLEVPAAAQMAPVEEREELPVTEASVPEYSEQLAVDSLDAPDTQDALDALDAPEATYATKAPEVPVSLSAPDAPQPDYLAAPPQPSSRSSMVIGLLAIVVILSAVVTWLWMRPPTDVLTREGELVVQARPQARVSIDGKPRGMTPQTLRLSAGAHVLEVQIGTSEPRVIPLTIRPGVQTSQYIELQNVPTTGGLEVKSDPTGARLSVDGQPRGTTPATLRDLPPGEHELVLDLSGRKATQVVRIEAGVTSQVVVPIPKK